jgi:hypothetical protein
MLFVSRPKVGLPFERAILAIAYAIPAIERLANSNSQSGNFYFHLHINHLQPTAHFIAKLRVLQMSRNQALRSTAQSPTRFLLASKRCTGWADFRRRYGRLAIFLGGEIDGRMRIRIQITQRRRSNLTKGRSSNQGTAGSRESLGRFSRASGHPQTVPLRIIPPCSRSVFRPSAPCPQDFLFGEFARPNALRVKL